MPTESPPPAVLTGALELLERLYSPQLACYSYSATLTEDGEINNDFAHASVDRYTINVLAGLQRVEQANGSDLESARRLREFRARRGDSLRNLGDRGLLLFVLAEGGAATDEEVLALTGARWSADGPRSLPLQDACWLLLGLARAAATTASELAFERARAVFTMVERRYLDHDSLFPLHLPAPGRRRFVSFGGIVYFLMALHHWSLTAGDRYAAALFEYGAQRVIDTQGPWGDWAWFYDTHTGRVVEWYELYTVHQLAMAPLFLLPAKDRGLARAAPALERSARWARGDNELGAPMLLREPFFTHRSIRRARRNTRAWRFARATARLAARRAGARVPRSELTVNPECRSYELGWLLYSWAGRDDLPTGLLDT